MTPEEFQEIDDLLAEINRVIESPPIVINTEYGYTETAEAQPEIEQKSNEATTEGKEIRQEVSQIVATREKASKETKT